MIRNFVRSIIAVSVAVCAGCAPMFENERNNAMSKPHVIGKISDCEAHKVLHPRLAKAFGFLQRSDLADLKVGRYEIDGDNCWAMISEGDLIPASERKLEAHRRYIDIQSPISGPELFGFATMDEKALALPFDTDRDCVLFEGASEPHVINPGEYAIFFPPLGAHAPMCIAPGGPAKVRKVVVKVLAD